ncbi:hypothetical protein ACHFJ0_05100 [Paracoccus sp. NGMCC 1.201697]|uniref:Tip attachment protein J domain-containing protein n=1 Tax=Paracoccus broussonetiae subsp. drimophilus TaxID=3373869 RepID=A0ABW7LIQ9_9RHOB
MAIFTWIATTAWWASVTAAIGSTVADAVIALGQSATWSLAASALARPSVSRQQVLATLSQTDAPRIRCYGKNLLGGQRAFFEAQDDHLHQIIVIHQGELDGLIQIWKDGEPIATDPPPAGIDGGGRIDRYTFAGFRDGSGVGGDYHGVFDSDGLGWNDIHEAFPTLWTAAHKLQNQATMYVVLGDPSDEDFVKYFPKGPNTQIQAEVRGALVRNNANAWVYSENAGLIIRDFMTHADGWAISLGKLDTTSWANFADMCAEQFSTGSGTEARYRLCGFYTLDDELKATTARMLATCDGQIYETAEGRVGILGGSWSTPDVTITADDILSLEMQDGFDPFNSYNVLKGTFVSGAHSYQPTEVAELRDEASIAKLGERVETFDADMVPSSRQLKALMRIKKAKDQREFVGTVRTNLVGMKARFPKGDGLHTIRIVASEFGINGVFEVTSHVFSIPDGFCEIGIASIVNPYGASEDDNAPVGPGSGDLGKPDHTVNPPTGGAITQVVVSVSGTVQGVKLALIVDAPGRDSLKLQAQVAQGNHGANSTTAAWVEMAVAGYRAETGILDDVTQYTVRYRWRGRSDWIKIGPITTVANPVTPAAPTSFSAVAAGPTVSLDWINAPTNYFRTRIYRNTVNNFGTATLITPNGVAGNAGQVSGYDDTPGGTGVRYYWAATVNASLVQSTPAGPQSVTL